MARAYRSSDPAIDNGEPGSPIPFLLSSPGVKRDGLNLATLPFTVDNYRANPVVLPFHDYLAFPIGRGEMEVADTPAGQAIFAEASFDVQDPIGELADRKYRQRFLFAVSLGWDDVDDRGVPIRSTGRGRAVARDVLEFSVVSVPADASALIDIGGRSGARALALDLARSRAFLGECREVLVASDPRADAIEEALEKLAACSGPECELLLADARQQIAGSERKVFALGAPDSECLSARESEGASRSDEVPHPESEAPADEATAEARRRAAMAAMVAAVWVDQADDADDKARKRAREALLPEYRRLGLVPPAYLDAVIVASLPPDRRAALFVSGELQELDMTTASAGTRVGKKFSGATRTKMESVDSKLAEARKLLKGLLDEAEDTSGERGCGCGGGQSSHVPTEEPEPEGVELEDALRALSILYPEAEIRATVKRGAPAPAASELAPAPTAARQVTNVNVVEVGDAEDGFTYSSGKVVLPDEVQDYLKVKAIKKLESGPDGSETSMWFSKEPDSEDWPITPQAVLGIDVLGSLPENVMSLLRALGSGVDPSILDIAGILATDPDYNPEAAPAEEEVPAEEPAAEEAPIEEPGTQSLDALLARFNELTTPVATV